MSNFLTNVADIGSWIWAYPLLILIVICGIVYSVRLGFLQFRHFPYIMKQTFGSIFKNRKAKAPYRHFRQPPQRLPAPSVHLILSVFLLPLPLADRAQYSGCGCVRLLV